MTAVPDTQSPIMLAYLRARQRTYVALSASRLGSRLSRIIDLALIVLIVANIVAVMAETVASVQARWGGELQSFENLSIAIFSLEYLLRLWSASSDPKYAGHILGRCRYAVSFMGIIDLLAIVPAYLVFVPMDLRTLRGLRLLRLARTLKIGRYSESLQSLGRVFVAKREELLTTMLAGLVLVVIASTLVYYAERDKQPDSFSSIPAVMWWAVATLTTVGYGDMYPQTTLGKLLGSIVAVLGIGLFALPAGILGSGFVEQLQEKKKRLRDRCPHCGKDL